MQWYPVLVSKSAGNGTAITTPDGEIITYQGNRYEMTLRKADR